VLGNKRNRVRRSEIYFLTSDVHENKKNNREVYKKLLSKGEKYKISTTHRVIRTKKNDVTAESMNCKNGDVPRN
jgi:hypothetical protein